MSEPSSGADVVRAVNALARIARMLERTVPGMTLADFRTLSAVDEGEARASRLAHRLAVGKPSLSATVDSLVRRGLLGRTAHESDQRAVDLAVTDPGRAALARAREALCGLVHALAERTPEPADTIAALIGLDAAVEGEAADAIAAYRRTRTMPEPPFGGQRPAAVDTLPERP